MAKRKIRLLNCNFRSASIKLAAEALTVVSITGPMDRLVADAMGISGKIYAKRANEDDAEICGYDILDEYYGAKFVLKPIQGTLDGKTKSDVDIEFEALKIGDFSVHRHRDDEIMMLAFKVTLIDDDAGLHQQLHSIKKTAFNCDIVPASKDKAEKASAQLKLVNARGGEDTDEVGEGEDASKE